MSQVSDHVLTSNYALRLYYQVFNSGRNEMYIEKEAHLVFQLLNQSSMRLVTFNPFNDEIFAFSFDRL